MLSGGRTATHPIKYSSRMEETKCLYLVSQSLYIVYISSDDSRFSVILFDTNFLLVTRRVAKAVELGLRGNVRAYFDRLLLVLFGVVKGTHAPMLKLNQGWFSLPHGSPMRSFTPDIFCFQLIFI